jgi:hypothetical protein
LRLVDLSNKLDIFAIDHGLTLVSKYAWSTLSTFAAIFRGIPAARASHQNATDAQVVPTLKIFYERPK